jgi:hypothetical protein
MLNETVLLNCLYLILMPDLNETLLLSSFLIDVNTFQSFDDIFILIYSFFAILSLCW